MTRRPRPVRHKGTRMTDRKVNYHGLEFVPSPWAEVVAMDASGRVYEYSTAPVKKEAHNAWVPTGRYKHVGYLNRHPVDWRYSLIRIVDLKAARLRDRAHPHADNMALYVEDARRHRQPWKLWQYCADKSAGWRSCLTHPSWCPEREYRRRPRTHMVNGFEVPAPETAPLVQGQKYYVADPTSSTFFRAHWWDDFSSDLRNLERNLVFLTAQDAIENTKAICRINSYTASNNQPGSLRRKNAHTSNQNRRHKADRGRCC